MPRVSIRHRTVYRYRNPVAFGEHRVMYRPQEAIDQRLVSAELSVSPEPGLLRHVHDVSGAVVGVARFDGRSDRLVFDSRVEVEHRPQSVLDLERADATLGATPFAYHPDDQSDLARSIIRRQPDPGETEAWARRFVRPVGRTRLSTLLGDMTHAIRGDFAYGCRLEGAPQTPAETLQRRTGSCRDFALLMIEAARSLGLAAQFASGYVYSTSTGDSRVGAGHTHAWARVYLPDCGWIDFDPTNGLVGGRDLIRVASVTDPRAAMPLHGSWDGLRSDFLGMDVEVDVRAEALEPEEVGQPAVPLRVAQGTRG